MGAHAHDSEIVGFGAALPFLEEEVDAPGSGQPLDAVQSVSRRAPPIRCRCRSSSA
ncbi:MAG: hypothetical protein U5R31_00515 [Acidimicrobiia bacterium]|nr:hypothetical protein [Acidimicrobiia bacterium]